MVHAARWKCRTQKIAKKSPSAHHRTNLSSYIFAIDNRKNLLNSNVSSTCLHNMMNFGPLAAEIDWRVWDTPVTPAYFNGIAYWLRYCTDVAQCRSTKLYRMFGRLLGWWYTIYTFWRLLPLTEFCQLQNSLCILVLRSPILSALLHGTRAAAVSQTLSRGTRNGITELSQRAPPVFGWAAITLGIGPHSS